MLIRGKIRRVGNSLAFLIPADQARQAKLRPGQDVEADLHPTVASPLGALKGVLPYQEYERRREGVDRDRV